MSKYKLETPLSEWSEELLDMIRKGNVPVEDIEFRIPNVNEIYIRNDKVVIVAESIMIGKKDPAVKPIKVGEPVKAPAPEVKKAEEPKAGE